MNSEHRATFPNVRAENDHETATSNPIHKTHTSRGSLLVIIIIKMTDYSRNAVQQQSSSILSDKVSRALALRTETPAMKAALDALSHMQQPHSNNTAAAVTTTTTTTALDSKSVRVAIEQDALQQALLLQKELQKLVSTVQSLRQGVEQTAAIAQRVQEATQMPVTTTEATIMETTTTPNSTTTTTMTMMPASSSSLPQYETAAAAKVEDAPVATDPLALSLGSSSSSKTKKKKAQADLEAEQKLASLLSESFIHRDLCRKRLDAVHAFLERFDLSQEDSRLLDHYAFEDIVVVVVTTTVGSTSSDHNPAEEKTNTTTNVVNGLAFLSALERVRKIRLALTDTFGSSSGDNNMAFLQQQQQQDLDNNSSSSGLERRGLGASSALRMMESLAQKQERAYERLYHWLQQYLHLFSAGSNNNNNNNNNSRDGRLDDDDLDGALQHFFVKQSLYTLRHVPAFYSHTLELIASSRRAEETRRFLLALTSGYAGFPPIEMKAHDPVACKSACCCCCCCCCCFVYTPSSTVHK